MKGIRRRKINLILIAATIISVLIALSGCSVNAEGKINLSMPKKISKDSIKIYENKIIIEKQGIHWGIVPDTGSMLPSLPNNSTLIWITDFKEIDIGDVVMVRVDNRDCRNVTHRVIAINDYGYTLKGDNNSFPDSCSYQRKDIYAQVVGVIY